MCFFYDKLVVHMCIYIFSIACMYSLHSCSCIHSMFSVHTITDICASSTTTERLLFHELFTYKDSCAYSSSCAHIIAHYIVVVFVKNCSTHLHEYFHHCLHVFTACMFMYSLQVLVHVSTNISASSTINRSTDVPLIVPMQVFMRILLIMCTNHCTL